MFRTPREVAGLEGAARDSVKPSVGRPPTPPGSSTTSLRTIPMADVIRGIQTVPTPKRGVPMQTTLKMGPKQTPPAGNKSRKPGSKTNGSILNFFQPGPKDNPSESGLTADLFLDADSPQKTHVPQTITPPEEVPSPVRSRTGMSLSPLRRFNEDVGATKRRKLIDVETRSRGPFLDDSDGEAVDMASDAPASKDQVQQQEPKDPELREATTEQENTSKEVAVPQKPMLERHGTSAAELDGFDGIEDFVDDEFPEDGEEFSERRWMQEQALLEEQQESSKTQAPACPICGGNTSALTDQKLAVHVNDCIDGKAKPLSGEPPPTRLQKAAIARPGQENPLSLTTEASSSHAFSKIMSGHAEDHAWAAAAAAEVSSRGKPAYQRTCPFYKIMPGFYICVDAFRYGAVQGCHAYFLSHFHSDHYIGLTSSWCHGPIYCSHVTANLVRRQLRVDPKWVVDLEFDCKREVPNTQGVEVTMIPANHCPGSSLFLFEKVVGRGKTPKVQRVLHCGDFRACPAHVQHPQLRPEILDKVTGRLAQQWIDVCYLDTTYLTPKYAFPTQADVIRACADMCVSLSKDFVDENDAWEQVKKERAGQGMVKFVRQASLKSEGSIQEEPEPEEIVKTEVQEETPRVNVKEEEHREMSKVKKRGRLLVIVGTYSIGKERICLGVAKALKSKIYAPPGKQKIVAALEDAELSALMTDDPLAAQVHMQMLMEIRAETLADYLTGFKPHFSRIVGFRPSGWNYRPPNSRFTDSPAVQTVLHSDNWKSRYSMAELVPQRGSTREANCFGVPYSEHSSFRELTMFCCALHIGKIIPTVNVGSAKSRERMKAWCDRWAQDRKKSGLYRVTDDQTAW